MCSLARSQQTMSSSALSMFYTKSLIWLLILGGIIVYINGVLQFIKGKVLYFTHELDRFCCM